MSSCFLCDCSYRFVERDAYSVLIGSNKDISVYMKQLPIMVGSTGTGVDDQQHKNNNKQNYVSYRVKKLEFCCSYFGNESYDVDKNGSIPDYVLIFKVPFRNPVFEYHFSLLKNFMLYSEPECVLSYKLLQHITYEPEEWQQRTPTKFNININKPFIVGPNDYVGVLYFFIRGVGGPFVDASAKVWFDLV